MKPEISDQPRRARRDAGLFGRRKGKALRPYQAGLMATLLPAIRVDIACGLGDPAALFPDRPDDLRLEIGFGGGEHLIETATRERDVGFIGCEPFVNGMAKLLARIEQRGLTNIRLHKGDAGDVIEWLPDASLARVYLFYPDPWPKRRHRKRRFVSAENLAKLARVLKLGGELRFATDIDDYSGWTLARLRQSPDFDWTARSASDWLTPWPEWTRTKYEDKAIAAGRKPVYLTFVRK
jgi:tRNA (guanine-N7-)-methyltransferase